VALELAARFGVAFDLGLPSFYVSHLLTALVKSDERGQSKNARAVLATRARLWGSLCFLAG